jgi:hypothetical protein
MCDLTKTFLLKLHAGVIRRTTFCTLRRTVYVLSYCVTLTFFTVNLTINGYLKCFGKMESLTGGGAVDAKILYLHI